MKFKFAGGRAIRTPLFAILVGISSLAAGIASAQDDAPPPKVSIAAVYSDEITEEALFIGEGEAIDQVDVIARVSGFVEEILVEDGAPVNEGDLLFRIEEETYAATLAARQADLGKAEADLELAKVELERKKELFDRGSGPKSEYDIALANEKAAEAAIKSAHAAIRQAEIELSYTEIKAPFQGRVGRMSVSVGELVGPTTPPLITLVREAPIYVRFSLTEKQLGTVLEALETEVRHLAEPGKTPDVFVRLPTGTELDESGKVVFVDNRISPTTGTIKLLAEFENARHLIIDGAFLHVRIEALEPTTSLLVPQASVQRDQRGDFVLVVNSKQLVEQRYVTLGRQVDAGVIVEDGLQEGENVIVEGLQRVRPGVEVDAVLTGATAEGQ